MTRLLHFVAGTRCRLLRFAVLTALTLCARADDFQGATHLTPFEGETINYNQAVTGVVTRLQKRIDTGAVALQHDESYGYVLAVLDELKVPKSSQMLVFSKTSLQREHISPSNPRAIFFSDDVYVGFIPGAPLIELSVADPKLGGVFYTLDQTKADKPRFTRNNQCLECHATSKTMGVPGHLARSFATEATGIVDFNSGISQVNHRTPFAERWGGWYVTGRHGEQTHRGNLVGPAAFARQTKEPNHAGNVTNLSAWFEVSRHVRDQSDVVALLVLEHQMHMHNFITRLNYEATLQLQQYGHLRYLTNTAESFLKYLLFAEEAPLAGRIQGSAEFEKEFTSQGPHDQRGRSLRDFDLRTRLFKHPCSYLIYSDAFDALPAAMKEHLYSRLWQILSGKDQSAAYASLSPAVRQALREILTETKRDLPDYWRKQSATARAARTGAARRE